MFVVLSSPVGEGEASPRDSPTASQSPSPVPGPSEGAAWEKRTLAARENRLLSAGHTPHLGAGVQCGEPAPGTEICTTPSALGPRPRPTGPAFPLLPQGLPSGVFDVQTGRVSKAQRRGAGVGSQQQGQGGRTGLRGSAQAWRAEGSDQGHRGGSRGARKYIQPICPCLADTGHSPQERGLALTKGHSDTSTGLRGRCVGPSAQEKRAQRSPGHWVNELGVLWEDGGLCHLLLGRRLSCCACPCVNGGDGRLQSG